MTYFVQHLSDEGVIQNIIKELSISYSNYLRKNDTDPVKETKVYPEAIEWSNQYHKLMVEGNHHGIFLSCYNVRAKILNSERIDGIISC